MTKLKCGAALMVCACAALFATQTRTWSQSDYADFEKGIIRHLSVRSDGLLTLAPHSRELMDTSSAYLWALAQDSKGNLYAGGGPGAKLFRIPARTVQRQSIGRSRRARHSSPGGGCAR